MIFEAFAVRTEGEETTYEMKLRYEGELHTVTIVGRFEPEGRGTRFVPSRIDAGGLPVDPDELRRSLAAALAR